jgi:hypothetical protein
MTRTCALLAIAVFIVACGKYGPPKRIRPKPAASSAVELQAEVASPEPAASAAQPETGTEPLEPDENQEKGP